MKHALLYGSHCSYSRGRRRIDIGSFLCSRSFQGRVGSFLVSVSTKEIYLLTLEALRNEWIVARVPGNDYAPPPSYEDHLAATQALSFRPPAYNHLGFPLPAGANPPPPPISNPLASANHPAGANPSAGSPPNPAKRPRPDSPDGNPHAAKRPHIV